jgi:regulator of protease activity HflC (stomatin/prohibitin superfamily)
MGMNVDPQIRTPSANAGAGYWAKRGTFNLAMALLLTFLLVAFSVPFTLKNVGPGERGVLWKRFEGGTVLDYTLGEGLHFILPWNRLYIYSIRLSDHVQKFDTISSDGLNMVVEIAVRYRIDPRRVPLLHKHVGPDYLKILIDPAVGSQGRELISLYTPEELYKNARSFIQNQISERLNRDNLMEIEEAGGAVNLLMIEDVLVRSITMPESVRVAIERKAEQNQVMLEYEYRLQREEREKERRRIEAEGLRAYREAMPNGILPSYLVLRGIEATLELAKSNNSKLIFFGNDPSNLPFILNSQLVGEAGAPNAKGEAGPRAVAPPKAAPSNEKVSEALDKLKARLGQKAPESAPQDPSAESLPASGGKQAAASTGTPKTAQR